MLASGFISPREGLEASLVAVIRVAYAASTLGTG